MGCALVGWACQAPSAPEPTPVASAPAKDKARILIVHSYSSDFEWTAGIQRGIERALSGADDIEWEVYFMDTKRRSSPEERKAAGELALAITEEWKPDVVLTTDDNAQGDFAKHLAGRQDVSVVFCGVNAEAEAYGFPASNVTGILQRPPVDRSVALLDEHVPGRRRLAMLADASPTADGAIAWIKKQSSAGRFKAWEQPKTFRAWKKAVRRLNKKADAVGFYTYHTVKDDEGKPVPASEVIAWTMDNLKIPSFSLLTFAIDDGALIGYVESAYENGLKSGKWALDLARGKSIEDMPMTAAVKGQTMINLGTAAKFGIEVPAAALEGFDVKVRKVKGDG